MTNNFLLEITVESVDAALAAERGDLPHTAMELVRHGRLDLTPLLTHTFSLDNITLNGWPLLRERCAG